MVTEAEARRLRPFMSGIVALAVALAAAIGWYFLGRPDEKTQPVPTVDWAAWIARGQLDQKIGFYVPPTTLPAGWRATSAGYEPGNFPDWELGILTKEKHYVGLSETKDSIRTLVGKYIDKNADQGKDVTIAGTSWQTWTDSGGDYGVARTISLKDGSTESLVVYGSAPDGQIRDYAASLTPQNPKLVG
jgi:hypothetical protein